MLIKGLLLITVFLLGGCGDNDDLDASNVGSLATTETLELKKSRLKVDRVVDSVINIEGSDVFVSGDITFTIADNVMSYVLLIQGKSIAWPPTYTSMHTLTSPSGVVFENKMYEHCGIFYCVVTVPRDEKLKTEAGVWKLALSGVDVAGFQYGDASFKDLQVTLATNTLDQPGVIEIAPFVASSHLEPEAIRLTMQALETYCEDLNIPVKVLPPKILADFNGEMEVNSVSKKAVNLSRNNFAEKVNLYLTEGFTDEEDTSGVAGFAAGVPGTLGFATTGMSIYVDALTNFPNSSYGVLDSEYNRRRATYSASIIAHEMGHLLGLDHTSNRDGSGNDLYSDTAACNLNMHDLNENKILDPYECEDSNNLMFWTYGDTVYRHLSQSQKNVLLNSPLQHRSSN